MSGGGGGGPIIIKRAIKRGLLALADVASENGMEVLASQLRSLHDSITED